MLKQAPRERSGDKHPLGAASGPCSQRNPPASKKTKDPCLHTHTLRRRQQHGSAAPPRTELRAIAALIMHSVRIATQDRDCRRACSSGRAFRRARAGKQRHDKLRWPNVRGTRPPATWQRCAGQGAHRNNEDNTARAACHNRCIRGQPTPSECKVQVEENEGGSLTRRQAASAVCQATA